MQGVFKLAPNESCSVFVMDPSIAQTAISKLGSLCVRRRNESLSEKPNHWSRNLCYCNLYNSPLQRGCAAREGIKRKREIKANGPSRHLCS